MARFLLMLLGGLLVVVCPAAVPDVAAQTGFYVGAFGGATAFLDQEIEAGGAEVEIEYDIPGYIVGGQIGYIVDTNVRVEAEVAYAAADADATLLIGGLNIVDAKYDLTQLTATAGVYLDLWPLGSFVPYVGGGLGYARITNEVNDIKDEQNAFTAFGEGGIPFTVTPQLAIVPSVRFTWVAAKEDEDELFAKNLYNTSARLGIRYSF